MTWHHEHGTRWERAMADVANGALGLIGICMLWVILTIVWPYEPMRVDRASVVGTARAGGVVALKVEYEKFVDWVPREVRWSLVDGVIIQLPNTNVSLPQGKNVKTFLIQGPPQMVPGVYTIEVLGIYAPWPWRDVPYRIVSQPFEVVP